MTAALLGGVGLFLLGMTLMTEGLKSAAGEALRDVLGRFTGGVVPAFGSGALLTALVQSSSATVLATIGFVSAGLIGFTQSVGVILGAAVGTTSTGWLVAFLGLKYSVSAVALPLVGAGALLRLLARGRLSALGLALAGFGLIFVGIDVLQGGMQTLAERFDVAELRADTAPQRLLLVAVGAAMTVVMQSSSAAVATTLAALHSGGIGLDAAASLVIGQSVGTSATAALASIGATAAARRTALAQILFSAFSGALAFLVLPWALPELHLLARRLVADAPGAIAVFHTAFTLLAALLLLPFAGRYAVLVARLVPERAPSLTRHFDPSLHGVPPVAIEAARRAVAETAAVAIGVLRERLAAGPSASAEARLVSSHEAVRETRSFLSGVRSSPDAGDAHDRHLAVLHALDHLDRLLDALDDAQPTRHLHAAPALRGLADALAQRLGEPLRWLAEGGVPPLAHVEQLSRDIARQRRESRPQVLARTAGGEVDPVVALDQLDAMRWIDRCAYHVWRIVHHLAGDSEPMAADV
jgi:phosphate:Na+ symporter